MVISCTQGYFASGEIQRDTHVGLQSGENFCRRPSGICCAHFDSERKILRRRQPRRCRRKWRFIGTFRQSQPWYPVRRLLCRPCHRIPPQKVPTKVVFHRHLSAIYDVARDVVQCLMTWAVSRYVVDPQIHSIRCVDQSAIQVTVEIYPR